MFYLVRSRRNPPGPGDRMHRRRPRRLRFRLSALGRNLSGRHRHDSRARGSEYRDQKKNYGRKCRAIVEIGLTGFWSVVASLWFEIWHQKLARLLMVNFKRKDSSSLRSLGM